MLTHENALASTPAKHARKISDGIIADERIVATDIEA